MQIHSLETVFYRINHRYRVMTGNLNFTEKQIIPIFRMLPPLKDMVGPEIDDFTWDDQLNINLGGSYEKITQIYVERWRFCQNVQFAIHE